MKIDWIVVLFEFLNFGVLMLLMGRFLFKPVREALDRRQAEAEALRQEVIEREEAAQALRLRYEEALAGIEAQAEERLDAVLAEADKRGADLLGEARARARSVVAEAEAEAERSLLQGLEGARAEVLQLAVAAAGRVAAAVSEGSVAAAYARRAAQALLQALGGGPLPGALTVAIDGDSDPEEIAAVLHDTLGEGVTIDSHVDPALICGVRLRAGGHEIESSVGESLRGWYSGVIASADRRAGASGRATSAALGSGG